MHLRGKDFQYEVVYPDGKTETLLSVPRYDFDWQSNYRSGQAVAAAGRHEDRVHRPLRQLRRSNPNNPESQDSRCAGASRPGKR